MDSRLHLLLDELAADRARARLGRRLAWCWAIAAALGLVLFALQRFAGWELSANVRWLPLILGLVLSVFTFMRRKEDAGEIRRTLIELAPDDPQVRHLFLAAAEQKPGGETGGFSFLQSRVIEEALNSPWGLVWAAKLKQRLARVRAAQAFAGLALAGMVFLLNRGGSNISGSGASTENVAEEITVTPGDASVERGTALVIMARFGGNPPAEAALVKRSDSGKESRIPMSRRLADPVFGATVSEVTEGGIYHIEYRGKKTRDYRITVFEYPALVRADAELRYPAYTGLTNRTIRDTTRVSAVTGTHLDYTLQLNKSVATARLVGKEQSISLSTQSNAIALLPEYVLTNSARFTLELRDAEGRSNKFPVEFVLQALTNQRPLVKLTFPRGDPRVSRLEELQLQAEASDDFGVLKYGFGFSVAGKPPEYVELGQSVPANTKRQFSHLISLEKLGVEVEQAVAYFAWADDYGPDGQPRRTFSDMFFAEVRPFDEVFRADQSGGADSGNQQGNQQGGGAGDQRVKLAELQKQIVIATWNLQREKSGAGGAIHP